ncbi:MAG TPA: hypothetical protein VH639_19465 [Bryobacteraceae bacterium]|jgi:hypothetical protein
MCRNSTRVLVTLGLTACVHGQWLNYPTPGTPRTRDGKPNLTAPVPRLNGKPDLSGVWQTERTSQRELASLLGNGFNNLQIDPQDFTKNLLNIFWNVKPGEEPLTPEGAAAFKRNQENPDQWSHTQCLPASVPGDLFVLSFKILQAPREILMLTEIGSPPRQIYTDGRSLPKDPEPTWMGYSASKWDGDTLLVETAGFKDRAWLDAFGHPRSEAMHITERYHRRDFGHMDLEIRFDDPKYYTRSFGTKATMKLLPDSDLLEYICAENERDRAHLGK